MKAKGKIIISNKQLKASKVIPREQWEKHFKLAIKAGHLPDKAKDKKISNQFDKSGWAW